MSSLRQSLRRTPACQAPRRRWSIARLAPSANIPQQRGSRARVPPAGGLTHSDLNFTLRTSTANGVARAAPVTLREVRLGQLSIDAVPAAVAENLNISLLGQTFLTRLESYEIRDGVLTLNYW